MRKIYAAIISILYIGRAFLDVIGRNDDIETFKIILG